MMPMPVRRLVRPVFLVLFLSLGLSAEAPSRAQLGRSVKLRILVDKVMQPVAKWRTEEWMVQAAAEAGFNVFSPRIGFNDLDAVRNVTRWCAAHDIYHLVWMRGTLNAPEGPEADGKRVIWENGVEQALWSVNADEFWDWTTRYILDYARISAQDSHLLGVFLDYENYAPFKQGNLYSLSYDDLILGKFAAAQGLELPELAPAARAPWLREAGLHDAFAAFQVEQWRERCRTLRQAVDALDPGFRFCLYPAPGTPFMLQAAFPEWSTGEAPIILADASTYGRRNSYLAQRTGLEYNRSLLETRRSGPADTGIPFLYAGGIDPAVRGADAEFCGKNAVALAGATDGYWVFYEGPTYTGDHPEYWRWFTWANARIQDGSLDAWQQPRETPEPFTIETLSKAVAGGQLKAAAPPGTPLRYDPPVSFRGRQLFVLAAGAGIPVDISVRNRPVGPTEFALQWMMCDASLNELGGGEIPHAQNGRIRFTPPADGAYLLSLEAGRCAYSILESNAPLALLTADGVRLIYAADSLYLKVLPETRKFTVRARGMGSETVRINLFTPDGALAESAQTTLQQARAAVTGSVTQDTPAKPWRIQLTKADEGVLEDVSLLLDKALPPLLFLAPEHVLY